MKYRGFYISFIDDCDENKGGLFCQVYVGNDCMNDDIDYFCIHEEELELTGDIEKAYSKIECLIKKYIDNNYNELCKFIKEECQDER